MDKTMAQCGVMSIKEGSAKPTGNKTEFEGIISSSRLDAHYERFNTIALAKMAKTANRGVKVLAEHNAAAQPIGRSLSAQYDTKLEQVTAKFYIQKGLNLRAGFNGGGYADSDSYIAAAQEGTTDGLSVGAYVNKETCDHCKTDMRRFSFFGMTFVQCENGHYPGQKIYVDKKGKEHTKPAAGLTEKRITATIEDADLFEFSMVSFGANPDAEITDELQKAFNDGKLSDMHLAQLNDRYAIKVQGNKLVGGFPPQLRRTLMNEPNVQTEPTTPTTPTTEPAVQSAPSVPSPPPTLTGSDNSLAEEWKAHAAQLQVTNDNLRHENELLKAQEAEVERLQAALREKDAEITLLRDGVETVEQQKWKIAQYDLICGRERERAIGQWNRWKGQRTLPGEEETKRKELAELQNYTEIASQTELFRAKALLKEQNEQASSDVTSALRAARHDNNQYV